jgi:hypothetical protein
LLAYKQEHGDLEVPMLFVVSSEAPWPEEAWGIKLGYSVNNIRGSGHYVKDHPERRLVLDALGFRWNSLAWWTCRRSHTRNGSTLPSPAKNDNGSK